MRPSLSNAVACSSRTALSTWLRTVFAVIKQASEPQPARELLNLVPDCAAPLLCAFHHHLSASLAEMLSLQQTLQSLLALLILVVLHGVHGCTLVLTLVLHLWASLQSGTRRLSSSTLQKDYARWRVRKLPMHLAVVFVPAARGKFEWSKFRYRPWSEKVVLEGMLDDVAHLVRWCRELDLESLMLYDEAGALLFKACAATSFHCLCSFTRFYVRRHPSQTLWPGERQLARSGQRGPQPSRRLQLISSRQWQAAHIAAVQRRW